MTDTMQRIGRNGRMSTPANAGHATIPSAQEVLVDGTFSGREARDVVLALIDSGIEQAKLRNLSSQIHLQEPDPRASADLDELQRTRSDVRRLLMQAASQGGRVRVRSTLSLEIEPASMSAAS